MNTQPIHLPVSRKAAAPCSRRRWLVLAGLLCLCGFSGCDLGTYDERVKERADMLRQQTAAAELLRSDQYTELTLEDGTKTGIKVLHPILFADSKGRLFPDSLAAEPKRTIPPGVPIPGFTYTHEWFAQAPDGSNTAFYVYHGVVPKSDGTTIDTVKEQLADNIRSAFPGARVEWEPQNLQGPGGQTVDWDIAHFLVTQEFAYYNEGDSAVNFELKEGHLKFGVHDTPSYVVVMGWRVPADMDEALRFLESADASMGTLKLQ